MDGFRASRRIRMRKQYDVCFRIYVCVYTEYAYIIYVYTRIYGACFHRIAGVRADATTRHTPTRRIAANGAEETRVVGSRARRTGDASTATRGAALRDASVV